MSIKLNLEHCETLMALLLCTLLAMVLKSEFTFFAVDCLFPGMLTRIQVYGLMMAWTVATPDRMWQATLPGERVSGSEYAFSSLKALFVRVATLWLLFLVLIWPLC